MPVKYFISYLPPGTAVKSAPPGFKLFRKFFYENSTLRGLEAVFLEIRNEEAANLIGMAESGKFAVVQNVNNY